MKINNKLINKIISKTNGSGAIIVGDIGMEWGSLDVTPSNGSGTNYYGSNSVTFRNRYVYTPMVMAVAGVGSTAINCIATISTTKTSTSIWISSTNNTARACKYFVVGFI